MTNPNWANRTMWTGDNLDIMRGTNSECVDLIYLDPPFNLSRNYAAPSVTTDGSHCQDSTLGRPGQPPVRAGVNPHHQTRKMAWRVRCGNGGRPGPGATS